MDSEYYDDEQQQQPNHPPKKSAKQNNALPLWGNESTMNLNPLILANIQGSSYFKVSLFKLKTYHEVVDEIYYQVKHLEPWERGSRKTSGQTGMCGGVRGVGAGGIVSTAFCLLYKLYTLRLTRKQVNGLLTHTDSPYIRALGFMNCFIKSRCVTCGGEHKTQACNTINENIEAKCFNCGGDHSTKNRSCPKRAEFVKIRQQATTRHQPNRRKTPPAFTDVDFLLWPGKLRLPFPNQQAMANSSKPVQMTAGNETTLFSTTLSRSKMKAAMLQPNETSIRNLLSLGSSDVTCGAP
ncbi:conserved hypothetical protein [Culex quinquefasciatus]|uniref:Pre-mRNA-splicing factor 38 n=1 Tax=Culex quinquefasciatus TaxID=7176 RepID=B0WBK3_CULQU|nr:conserved hypothetical protein [Culex quinquefasciatus]|eukprot:XP_001846087.1 conserved hypothetical protein [Culex quinquefasciatus]